MPKHPIIRTANPLSKLAHSGGFFCAFDASVPLYLHLNFSIFTNSADNRADISSKGSTKLSPSIALAHKLRQSHPQ